MLPTSISVKVRQIKTQAHAVQVWRTTDTGDTFAANACAALNRAETLDRKTAKPNSEPPVRLGDVLGAISGCKTVLRTYAHGAGIDWPVTSAAPIGVVRTTNFLADRGHAAVLADVRKALKVLDNADTLMRESLDLIRIQDTVVVESNTLEPVAA